MKRLLVMGIAAFTGLLVLGTGVAEAELETIYGPVYVTKAKVEEHHRHDAEEGKKHEGHDGKVERDSGFTFRAPVPGAGIIIVKNGGTFGHRGRVASAEIELNDQKVAGHKDFNKHVEILRFNVDLRTENELEVEVKSCRNCELEITVLGEKPVELPPRVILPVRGTAAAPI